MMKQLENVLHSEIPLTREIGIKVVEYTGDSLTLSAPLENNINHKCTAFGGSLYSVSVLSGWGLVYLLMKEHSLKGHIVIQESNTRFLKPVTSELIATCAFDSTEQKARFVKTYQRRGRARVAL
ncbi:MAG: YiiD C-terminal domain-containing protein, partial [Candidatus Thiodiazotropha sp.]